MVAKPFRCFLIGGNTLLMACAERLLDQGHQILGIISGHDRIAAWAKKHQLPCHSLASDYAAVMAEQPFDFLFSITHLAVIPEPILDLPVHGVVNFHDGPLPHFAGLNTPVWALLEGVSRYGVTWHWVTSEIDRGDILHQVHFDLEPSETALTLNARCFDEGLRSFGTLVEGLANSSLMPQPQQLSAFRYFAGNRRPVRGAILDWTQSAATLDRLIRALDFGHYPNPLTTAKLFHKNELWIVKKAEITKLASRSSAQPGILLTANTQGMTIACGEDALTLTALATMDGKSLSIQSFMDWHQLEIGRSLDAAAPVQWETWDQQLQTLAKHEGFWLRRLRVLPKPLSATSTSSIAAQPASIWHLRQQHLPNLDSFSSESTDWERQDWLLATLALIMARIHEQTRVSLGWQPTSLSGLAEPHLGSTVIPLSINVDPAQPFTQFLAAIARQRRVRGRRFSFALDIAARYPDLLPSSKSTTDPGADRPLESQIHNQSAFRFPVVISEDPQVHLNPPSGSSLLIALQPTSADHPGTDAGAHWHFDTGQYNDQAIDLLHQRVQAIHDQMVVDPTRPLGQVSLLLPKEQRHWHVWNQTAEPVSDSDDPVRCFEAQVAHRPEAIALVSDQGRLSFAELNARSNQLAHYLTEQGAGPGTIIGIHLERGTSMIIAALATLKCGAAYLPLDPEYPLARLLHMITDSGTTLLISNDPLGPLDRHNFRWINPQAEAKVIAGYSNQNPTCPIFSQQLAYLIYTSGSTGTPKGVMVARGNLANFALAINRQIPGGPGDTWLAVTSLSFDISVLELWWTLARGFKVVLLADRARQSIQPRNNPALQFSLFYFSSANSASQEEPYRLLLEGAKYADSHGFSAVWTPERHFHDFGGIYAHPAITGAALATVTQRIQIRAGSVVLPLHHPVRVAEAWSMVDNLSGGRVGVSFASGWQPSDFILQPQNHGQAKEAMFRDIEVVKRLWRGERVSFPGPDGQNFPVSTLPRPKQEQLPIWITTAGNVETYRRAGEIGAHLLTHLLGQSIDELAPKIAVYREARAKAGFDPDSGIVSLMLHTFLGENEQTVRNTVWQPLKAYLASSLGLLQQHATSFPAFKQTQAANLDDAFAGLSEADKDAMLDHACDRYFRTSGLFGTVDQAQVLVQKLQTIGVNDIACLIDFGIPEDQALQGLDLLDRLRRRTQQRPAPKPQSDELGGAAIARLLSRHQVSHLQATPTFMQMLMLDPVSRAALGNLQTILVGGEAWPTKLADDLLRHSDATLRNMYGPTETTVWSSVAELTHTVPLSLGRPIANTALYIVDSHLQLVPEEQSGELLIGGLGVTLGYHGRPSLTATRFICDPFSEQPGMRLYRTGDRVAWESGGRLRFIGRMDFQVKIRGFRIELGEVETVLQAHPRVHQCAVVARSLANAEALQIVAYVVAEETTNLLDDLRATLPHFMVPARLVKLAALPLTPNGKIDRNALPDPGKQARLQPAVRPENPEQERVANIWQRILERQDLSIDDNFFDMGGDSLLVVGIHQFLLEAFPNRPIQLTDLYRFTTIRRQAEFLAGEQNNSLINASADRGQRRRRAVLRRR